MDLGKTTPVQATKTEITRVVEIVENILCDILFLQ